MKVGLIVFLSLLFMAILFWACSGAKQIKVVASGPIVFGSFGGFAGSYDEITLTGAGEVRHKNSLKGTNNVLPSIKPKQAQQLIESIVTLNIDKMTIDDPGNLTYFLKFRIGEKEHHLQWGGGAMEPPQPLKDYFRLLRKLTNNRNPTM